MSFHSPFTVLLAAGLIVFTTIKTAQTREPHYFVWLLASVMMLIVGINNHEIFRVGFLIGIVATMLLQWRRRRREQNVIAHLMRMTKAETYRRERFWN